MCTRHFCCWSCWQLQTHPHKVDSTANRCSIEDPQGISLHTSKWWSWIKFLKFQIKKPCSLCDGNVNSHLYTRTHLQDHYNLLSHLLLRLHNKHILLCQQMWETECVSAGTSMSVSLQPVSYLSASSRMTILWRPFGKVTFCMANILILLRTTSIPLKQYKNRIKRTINIVYLYLLKNCSISSNNENYRNIFHLTLVLYTCWL